MPNVEVPAVALKFTYRIIIEKKYIFYKFATIYSIFQ